MATENLPPLASIDETEDDDISGTSPDSPEGLSFVPSSCNKNLLILTNSATVTSAVPSNKRNVFSPESDDYSCLTNSAAAAEEEGADTGFFSSSISCSSKRSSIDSACLPGLHLGAFTQCQLQNADQDEDELMDDFFLDKHCSMPKSASRFTVASTPGDENCSTDVLGSQSSDLSNSLEDLVNSFDCKVKHCLVNYGENVSTLAPVQKRSPEEFIRDKPAWCTVTGNDGNILSSVDWSKMAPEGCHRTEVNSSGDAAEDDSTLEDAVEEAKLQHLLYVCLELDRGEPIERAEDLLDDISCLYPPDLTSLSSEHSLDLTDMPIRRMSFYRFSLEKLKNLSLDELQDLNEDLETKVQRHSEVLVKQLARRDELEFEKEQKNVFISLMLSLQNRRKVYFQEEQHTSNRTAQGQSTAANGSRKRYLTTLIPYNSGQAADNVPVLQVLIKILKAMLEDSPTVPTLLTDYILTHICPSESYSKLASRSTCEQSTYLRSALRSLARAQLGTVSTQAVSQLRASLNSKLKSAVRRSFSLSGTKNGSVEEGSKCASVFCQNNNPDAVQSRKNSLAGANFDTFNTIVA